MLEPREADVRHKNGRVRWIPHVYRGIANAFDHLSQPRGIHCSPSDPGSARLRKGVYSSHYCRNCGKTSQGIMHGCRNLVKVTNFAEKTQGDVPTATWNRPNAGGSVPQALCSQ